MSTGNQTCEITIPGYTLAERIGAGGYAEVWRAEAPGGIAKAVKIVYGYCDDEFASQELKALERIKGVRHPFLLSLERFDLIGGRLVILTELADMSLEQRLRQCRSEGLPGIPRDELLRYMADAAEALDFLSQRHSLLHLDIKPENLLVLGDHIKVADFGLVKELASRTQNSMISGMTPTYASPEMFDDDPSAASDQYSLAIVYQEMLVGALPFPGRTAAQLAKQHTQSEPQLLALPADDREIVGRALAKSPAERFPSCKAFVNALANSGRPFAPRVNSELAQSAPALPTPALLGPNDTKPTSSRVTLPKPSATPAASPQARETATQPIKRPSAPIAPPQHVLPAEPLPREEVVDVTVPNRSNATFVAPPTLYIAVGGLGANVLCRMRSLLAKDNEARPYADRCESIAIDTSRDDLREACSGKWESPLRSDDTLHIPLKLPKCYDDARDILGWVSRRWLYNIPRSLETRGYRPLGRVALVDHGSEVRKLIDDKVARISALAKADPDGEDLAFSAIRIVILASTGGGSGSGVVIDVANAAKASAANHGLTAVVQAFLLCNCFANNSASPLLAANTYALLAELEHVATHGNETSTSITAENAQFESAANPFDHVYWLPVRSRTNEVPSQDSLETIAWYLAAEMTSEIGGMLAACRQTPTPREDVAGQTLRLRKFGMAALNAQKQPFVEELAAELAEEVKRFWLTVDTATNWRQVLREWELANSNGAAAINTDPPQAITAAGAAEANLSLSLRARFREHLCRNFVNEFLKHAELRMQARNERNRVAFTAGDSKLAADVAFAFVSCLASEQGAFNGTPGRFSSSHVLRSLILTVSDRFLRDELAKYDHRQTNRFLDVATLGATLVSCCSVVLGEAFVSGDTSAALNALVDRQKVIHGALKMATVDLVQVGADRRTLVFTPRSGGDEADLQALSAARPLAGVQSANVDDVLIISEDSGIAPRSLAARLREVFPGIADAASRLHTRTDISWASLES